MKCTWPCSPQHLLQLPVPTPEPRLCEGARAASRPVRGSAVRAHTRDTVTHRTAPRSVAGPVAQKGQVQEGLGSGDGLLCCPGR